MLNTFLILILKFKKWACPFEYSFSDTCTISFSCTKIHYFKHNFKTTCDSEALWYILNGEVSFVFYQKQGTAGVLFFYGLVEKGHALRVFLVYVGPCSEESPSLFMESGPQGQTQHRLTLGILDVEAWYNLQGVYTVCSMDCWWYKQLESGIVDDKN